MSLHTDVAYTPTLLVLVGCSSQFFSHDVLKFFNILLSKTKEVCNILKYEPVDNRRKTRGDNKIPLSDESF